MLHQQRRLQRQGHAVDHVARAVLEIGEVAELVAQRVDPAVERGVGALRPPSSAKNASTTSGDFFIARSTSRHCTLPLPSQIALTGDSRNRRGIGLSSITPLPPMHSIAS